MDIVTNKYGDNLLSLCKSVPLRICNGRKLGDILGSYTCYTPNGQSCVDYCLASPRIYDRVKTLSVGVPDITLSDHCPVKIILEVKVISKNVSSENYEFVHKPKKLSWNKDISYKFENILQSSSFSSQFNNFLEKDLVNCQIALDTATQELSNLLVEGATLAASAMQPGAINKKIDLKAGSRRKCKVRKAQNPKWHDLSCDEAHRIVITIARLLKGDPKNSYLGGKLRKATKTYNKLVKSKHKQFVDNMFTELDSMEHDNPRGYMELIKSMREGNFDKQTPDDTSNVSPSDWQSHFSNLLSKKVDPIQKRP